MLLMAMSYFDVPSNLDTMLYYKVDCMLDWLLAKKKIEGKEINCYAMVCFVVQWKMELVIQSPLYEEVADFLEDLNAEAERLVAMELDVLRLFDYQCYVVTAYDFVRTFMCHGCYYYREFEREEFFEKSNPRNRSFAHEENEVQHQAVSSRRHRVPLHLESQESELRAPENHIRKAISKRVHKRFR